jgi:hypothetical protein
MVSLPCQLPSIWTRGLASSGRRISHRRRRVFAEPVELGPTRGSAVRPVQQRLAQGHQPVPVRVAVAARPTCRAPLRWCGRYSLLPLMPIRFFRQQVIPAFLCALSLGTFTTRSASRIVPREQKPVPAGPVVGPHLARIVHRHAEFLPVAGNRLQQAVLAQIDEHIVRFGPQIPRRPASGRSLPSSRSAGNPSRRAEAPGLGTRRSPRASRRSPAAFRNRSPAAARRPAPPAPAWPERRSRGRPAASTDA